MDLTLEDMGNSGNSKHTGSRNKLARIAHSFMKGEVDRFIIFTDKSECTIMIHYPNGYRVIKDEIQFTVCNDLKEAIKLGIQSASE